MSLVARILEIQTSMYNIVLHLTTARPEPLLFVTMWHIIKVWQSAWHMDGLALRRRGRERQRERRRRRSEEGIERCSQFWLQYKCPVQSFPSDLYLSHPADITPLDTHPLSPSPLSPCRYWGSIPQHLGLQWVLRTSCDRFSWRLRFLRLKGMDLYWGSPSSLVELHCWLGSSVHYK